MALSYFNTLALCFDSIHINNLIEPKRYLVHLVMHHLAVLISYSHCGAPYSCICSCRDCSLSLQAKIDFNSCLSENGKLRETFDHMRVEKKTFDTIRLKLEKELAENKQKIMDGIETSTAAYEARFVPCSSDFIANRKFIFVELLIVLIINSFRTDSQSERKLCKDLWSHVSFFFPFFYDN